MLRGEKMKVSSIFMSLQGEGLRIGEVSTFVRLTGCNRVCRFCDQPDTDHYTLDIVSEDLAKSIQGKNVVITGGEPLLQDEIYEFVGWLHECGKFVTIETNGDFDYLEEEEAPDLFSVSPKFPASTPFSVPGVYEDFERKIDVWDNLDFDVVFKYVVENEEQLTWILDKDHHKPVIIQPCEPEKAIVPSLMKCLNELDEKNIRVIPQTHKYLKVL